MIFVLLNFSSYQRYRTKSALGILQAILAMPQSKSNRFDLANFIKERKDMRQKAVEQSKAMKTQLNTINRRITAEDKGLCVNMISQFAIASLTFIRICNCCFMPLVLVLSFLLSLIHI